MTHFERGLGLVLPPPHGGVLHGRDLWYPRGASRGWAPTISIMFGNVSDLFWAGPTGGGGGDFKPATGGPAGAVPPPTASPRPEAAPWPHGDGPKPPGDALAPTGDGSRPPGSCSEAAWDVRKRPGQLSATERRSLPPPKRCLGPSPRCLGPLRSCLHLPEAFPSGSEARACRSSQNPSKSKGRNPGCIPPQPRQHAFVHCV